MFNNEEKEELYKKHLEFVLKANKIHNLTNITNFEEAYIMHVEDSLAALNDIKSNKGKLVDLGSGAGYPGIPLAISTGLDTVLVESVIKKADCLKSFILKLGLVEQVFVSNKRIEELSKECPNSFNVATARALSSLSSLIELASPLLVYNGILICYKAENIDEELENSLKIQDKLGMKLISNRTYQLCNGRVHRIVIFKKIADSKINLPRKYGIAQKRPLI